MMDNKVDLNFTKSLLFNQWQILKRFKEPLCEDALRKLAKLMAISFCTFFPNKKDLVLEAINHAYDTMPPDLTAELAMKAAVALDAELQLSAMNDTASVDRRKMH